MYNDEERFSLKTIIIQILFVVLFIFILLWLFPTKGYVEKLTNKSVDNQISDAISEKLQPFYNQIFNQNIMSMKEGARDYFTTSRLPQNIGDTRTMTLREMLEKKLVLPFSDSNGQECDLYNSYVKVTKMDDEYVMTVNLTCSDKSDYIDVYMGCYNYCESSVCEKETLNSDGKAITKDGTVYTSKDGGTSSYKKPSITKPKTDKVVKTTKKYICEYEKVTSGKWGEWSDWSEWSSNKVGQTDYREVETKEEKIEKGEETVQTGTKTEVVDAIETEEKTYSCPTGYTVSGEDCVKSSSIISTIPATEKVKVTYNCPSGYEKSGSGSSTKCTKKVTTDYSTKTAYSCDSGYKSSGTGKNMKCTKTTTKKAKTSTYYTCKSGTLSGKYCNTYKYANPTYSYSYGAWSGKRLQSFSYAPATTDTARYTYHSVTVNTNCKNNCNRYTYHYYVQTRSVKTIMNCPSGYNKSGSSCVKSVSVAATKKTKKSCDSGYKLSGSKCVKTTTKSATKKKTKTCPSGYKLSGSKCVKTKTSETIKNETKTYSCTTGSLNGTDCVITNSSTDTIKATVNITKKYSCPDEYELSDKKCLKEVPVYEKVKIYDTKVYYRYRTKDYISGNRDIKWSNCDDKRLLNNGYVLTGNKKEKK